MSLRSRYGSLSTAELPHMDTNELKLHCVRCKSKVSHLKCLPCLHPISICEPGECNEGVEKDDISCIQCQERFDYPAAGFPMYDFALRKAFQEQFSKSGLHCYEEHDSQQPAVVFCSQCPANLCQECWDKHKRSGILSRHTTLPLADALSTGVGMQCSQTCAKHSLPLEVFCHVCLVMVCYLCRTEDDHRGHSFGAPDDGDLLKNTEHTLLTCIQSSQRAARRLQGLSEEVDRRKSDLSDQSKAAETAVCEMIDSLMKTLQSRKDVLLAEIDKIAKEGQEELESFRNTAIQPRCAMLEMYQQAVEDIVKNGTAKEQNILRKVVVNRIDHLSTATLPPTFPAPPSVLFEHPDNFAKLSADLLSVGLVSRGVHPPSCTMEGLVVTDNIVFYRPWADNPLSFDVLINDDSGKSCILGNEAVRAVLTPTTHGAPYLGSIAQKTFGTHCVSFSKLPSQQCDLAVTVNGEHIRGSPLQVHLMNVEDLGGYKKEFDCRQVERSFRALCVGGDGQLLCTDNHNSEVCRFSQHGDLEEYMKLESGSCFNGIAELSQGNIAVSCYGEDVVHIYRPGGKLIGKIGQPKLKGPRGIVAVNSRIFVADRCNHKIRVFAEDGRFLSDFGGLGRDPENLHHPDQMALGPKNEIYVADTGNKCIKVYQTNGAYTRCAVTDVTAVSGLAVMATRHIVVSLFWDNRVKVFDPKGCTVHSFAVDGPHHPYGLAFGREGQLFVANLGTPTISQF